MHEKMMYIFLQRVYIQNMGNGNAFGEQKNKTKTKKKGFLL